MPVLLTQGLARPIPERWQALDSKINFFLATPNYSVIQVPSDRFHIRKNNCHVPESLKKLIPIPKSLYPHLCWWLKEKSVLSGQPLHSFRHADQIFTDASNEDCGTHLGDFTTKSIRSLPESKLHISYLGITVH